MAYYGQRDADTGPGFGLLLVLALVVLAGLLAARVVAGRVGLDGSEVGSALVRVLAPPMFSAALDEPERDQPLRIEHPARTGGVAVSDQAAAWPSGGDQPAMAGGTAGP